MNEIKNYTGVSHVTNNLRNKMLTEGIVSSIALLGIVVSTVAIKPVWICATGLVAGRHIHKFLEARSKYKSAQQADNCIPLS